MPLGADNRRLVRGRLAAGRPTSAETAFSSTETWSAVDSSTRATDLNRPTRVPQLVSSAASAPDHPAIVM